SFHAKRFGFDRKHNQRFRCHVCGKTWIQAQVRMLGTMRIDEAKALMAINMFVEGCSVRTIERLTGIGKTALLNLLVLAGERCEKLMHDRIHNIPLECVEADEIWGFVRMKEARKNTLELSENDKIGDAYCFVGIE